LMKARPQAKQSCGSDWAVSICHLLVKRVFATRLCEPGRAEREGRSVLESASGSGLNAGRNYSWEVRLSVLTERPMPQANRLNAAPAAAHRRWPDTIPEEAAAVRATASGSQHSTMSAISHRIARRVGHS
jgi:hypothetical protein